MKTSFSEQSGQILKNHLLLKLLKENNQKLKAAICVLTILIFSSLDLTGQPSGGPFGPVPQTYQILKTTGKIYFVAPDGQAKESGESLSVPTTIESAFERVKTGDVIILRGGTYRTGNLILNQGITLQPYADEQPVLKGTFVASNWKKVGNSLWTTSWDKLFPSKPAGWWQRLREGKHTPIHRFNNDMVFIDGKYLHSAGWEGEVNDKTFFIDYETKTVYIGIDPTEKLVEITAFDIAIHRINGECHGKSSDRKGPVIKGITFTQYAYRAIDIDGINPEGVSDESKHGKEVTGTVLEHCAITFCSRVAAYLRGDKLVVRHCKISDTSTEGIYVLSSSDVLLEKNIFARNNIENITGYYPAAVKIFNQCYRVTCNDNLVIDHPNSNGIWYDVGNVDGVFINNWVENVGMNNQESFYNSIWPSQNGFFFEISKGAICAGNIFVNCDHGILVLNSSNVQIYQNTFINSIACIGRDGRVAAGDHFGWHPSSGPDFDKREGHVFVNNLVTGDKTFRKPLFLVWQPDQICSKLTKSQLKQFDNNVFVRNQDKNNFPLILWGPSTEKNCQAKFDTPENMNKVYPEFSGHSKYFVNESIPLFKSLDLGNYQVLGTFPGNGVATALSAEIAKLLNLPKKHVPYIGAYPPNQ